ncbi:MAG: sulfotransferase, partial [Candidatus Nanopelagicales bacterium]|nr:sulfotransferase [Candidatus Nanopelagicales bacterium]
MSNAERPILVGGTGRSGSTIVGHLLDHHPDVTLTRPMEVRFITGNDGIADALAVAMRKPGSAKAEAAVRLAATRIMERWFRRAADVGLHTSVER